MQSKGFGKIAFSLAMSLYLACNDRKVFSKNISKFYRKHYYELFSESNDGLNTLLPEVLSEPEFYDDLVYKFKKRIGRNDFSFQF